MGRAKEIVLKVLPAKAANEFVRKWHYSGKVVNNSTLHFGAFLDGALHGVMSFGSPLDKRKVLPLVHTADGVPCLWNEMLELNRMAFDDVLPKNSESRCLAIAFRLIRKNAPHIRWILSFSDGTQCGDGAIYRASGFVLTGINGKAGLLRLPGGEVRHRMAMHSNGAVVASMGGKMATMKDMADKYGAEILAGFQLRYIYLLDKSCRLNCPVLPFSRIDELGAGMYRGEKITLAERQTNAAIAHSGERRATSPEGAFDATGPLQYSDKSVKNGERG